MFTKWRDFSPSGEISCPRLSYPPQDLKQRRVHLCHFLPCWTQKTHMGCSTVAFSTICKTHVVSVTLTFLSHDFFFFFAALSSLSFSLYLFGAPEGSAHSNDSLSESSSPASGVPTQVVQPVQTTTQVRHRPLLEEVHDRHASFMLTSWLFSPAEVSVADGAAGRQEDSVRTRQQPAICTHQPRGKDKHRTRIIPSPL